MMKAKLFILSFVFILTTIFTNQISANPVNNNEDPKSIIGTWQFKKNLTPNTKNQKQESFTEALFAAESLVLATDNGIGEITINEGFKEFIQTQTLPTDGTTITKNVYNLGKVSSKAFWQKRKLIVEIKTEKGEKINESFELSTNRRELFVTLNITHKQSGKSVKIRRVYYRVPEIKENNTAQVTISDYLL